MLNVRHQAQKGFCGIFVGIPQHQKGYLVYVPHIRNIISLYNIVFDVSFSSALEYTSQPYTEAMDMLPDVSYILYATSSRKKSSDIITFANFEEKILLSETRDSIENGDKSDDDSTLALLISEEEMDVISSGGKFYDELTMLEDIRYGSQSHPSIIF